MPQEVSFDMMTMLKGATMVVFNPLARLFLSHANRKRFGANKESTLMAKLQSIQDQHHNRRRISLSETEPKEELTRYVDAWIKKLEARIKKLDDEEDALLEMVCEQEWERRRRASCTLAKKADVGMHMPALL